MASSLQSTSDDLEKRLHRKIEGQLQEESMWLQNLLFALHKVEDARKKLAVTQQQKLNPLVLLGDGTPVPMGLVALNVKRRVDEVMEALGQGAHRLPS